jgi:hypothetical protein
MGNTIEVSEDNSTIVVGSPSPIAAARNQGFMDYNDTSTTASPLALLADTWTSIPNNGLGSFTNKAYKPTGVTELMDTTTGYIDPSELDLGDVLIVRNDYIINPDGNNKSLTFRYTLGSGVDAYTLERRMGRLDEGSSVEYRFSLVTDMIYMGDANTRDNPIVIQVKLEGTGTLVNSGTAIAVSKYEV